MSLARARAFALWPYMASVLTRMALVEKKGVGTMAVTDKWQVLWDPAFVNTLTLDQRAAVLCHEAWHLLRGHSRRRGDRDPKLWNIACDIAINDDGSLRDMLPSNGCYPEQFASMGVRSGMLEEDIYDLLMAQQPEPPTGGPDDDNDEDGDSDGNHDHDDEDGSDGGTGGPGGGQDPDVSNDMGKPVGKKPAEGACGSGAGGKPAPGEGDDGDPVGDGGHSSMEDELVMREVAEAIQTCGSASGGARRWASDVLAPPVIPWQRVLRAAIRRAMLLTRGATDYSYGRRPKVRSGVILPTLVRPQMPVAIVLDTSGSISGPMLNACLAEIDGILKAVRLPCVVLACDAQVHGGAQRVTTARDVKPLGGGGTDMGKGIAAAEALRPKHGATIVVTDGYTPWPRAKPSMPCIVCLIGASDGSSVSNDVPQWATKVHVSNV